MIVLSTLIFKKNYDFIVLAFALFLFFCICITSTCLFVSAQIINDNSINESANFIPQIYPSLYGGEVYRFNNLHPNDLIQVNETDDLTIFSKQNPDKSWRVDAGMTRIEIFTKNASTLSNEILKQKAKSWNYTELEKIGYWLSPKDWKNIEFTLIFKFDNASRYKMNTISQNNEHDISIVTRSIFHDGESNYKKLFGSDENSTMIQNTSQNTPYYCAGSSYHNNLSNDGHVRMKKEEFHVRYDTEKYDKNVNLGNLTNKIVGFKAIVFNSGDNKKVKLETWVDTEHQGKGPYKKVHERIDTGTWGEFMKICGSKNQGAVISWGSPNIVIKTNNVTFDIYDIEAREIIPPHF